MGSQYIGCAATRERDPAPEALTWNAMRVFLAVDLRDTMGQAATAWGRAVATALGPRDAASLTWIPAARIHVTLHFFGDLDRTVVDGLPAVLGAVPEPPFDVTFEGGGTFPPVGRPRVLWLGVGAGAPALVRLHGWLQPRVAGIGQPDRHGTFAPHVTIARVRRDAGPAVGRVLRDVAARVPAPAGRARIEAITLFESVPSAQGPSYVPLARLPLDAGATSLEPQAARDRS
jgi:2'-5' RNA ligase